MRILADENIELFLVAWLRKQGHDVCSIREICPGSSDAEVLRMASESGRVLISADKDFGELVFRQGRCAAGVILVRLHTVSRQDYLELFQRHFLIVERMAPGNFVTVGNRALRIRPLSPKLPA